jgi:hypothetical protein
VISLYIYDYRRRIIVLATRQLSNVQTADAVVASIRATVRPVAQPISRQANSYNTIPKG